MVLQGRDSLRGSFYEIHPLHQEEVFTSGIFGPPTKGWLVGLIFSGCDHGINENTWQSYLQAKERGEPGWDDCSLSHPRGKDEDVLRMSRSWFRVITNHKGKSANW